MRLSKGCRYRNIFEAFKVKLDNTKLYSKKRVQWFFEHSRLGEFLESYAQSPIFKEITKIRAFSLGVVL